jgi:hypothetical protein
MSEEIGARLPPPLRFELGSHPVGGLPKAVLLVTSDAGGAFRVAILGAGEVVVRDETHVQFSLLPGSQTCANLDGSRKAALWYVLDAAAYCIRGETHEVAAPSQAANMRRFELKITSILKDFRPEAPMVSGPTYKRL